MNYCVDQLWNIKDKTSGKEVPDGITIFVHTNCSTREPLAMEKQDSAYAAPGVALDKQRIQKVQQDWVWNSCSFTLVPRSEEAQGVYSWRRIPR